MQSLSVSETCVEACMHQDAVYGIDLQSMPISRIVVT